MRAFQEIRFSSKYGIPALAQPGHRINVFFGHFPAEDRPEVGGGRPTVNSFVGTSQLHHHYTHTPTT